MRVRALCNACGEPVSVIEPGYMLRHWAVWANGLQLCPASGSNDFSLIMPSVKKWVRARKILEPAAGQVWRDLANPGRTLTINRVYKDGATWFCSCTSYTPGQKRPKLTRIMMRRFGPQRVWIRKYKEYRDKGFERIELIEVSVWPHMGRGCHGSNT